MADSAQDSSHHSYPVQNFNNGEADKRCPKAELYGKSEDTVWKKKNGAHTPHLSCRYLSSGRRTYTPAHAHTCTPLALGQREAFLCAPVRACPAGGRGEVSVYVQLLCACARRHVLRPYARVAVHIGKCDSPRFEMATLGERNLGGGSRKRRQMALEDHNSAWPPVLALWAHCPSPYGLEDLGGPARMELTQAP